MRREEKKAEGTAERIVLEDLDQVSGGSEIPSGDRPEQEPVAESKLREAGADPSVLGGMSVEGVLDRIALTADQVRIGITKAATGIE